MIHQVPQTQGVHSTGIYFMTLFRNLSKVELKNPSGSTLSEEHSIQVLMRNRISPHVHEKKSFEVLVENATVYPDAVFPDADNCFELI